MATEPRSDIGAGESRRSLSIFNGGDGRERIRVVQVRDGAARDASRTLDPGETASFGAPDGTGQVRIELYTHQAVAATNFDPVDGSAFLDVVDGVVTVSRVSATND